MSCLTFHTLVESHKYVMQTTIQITFPALGEEWAPVVLDSEEEWDYIFNRHSALPLQRYWIGGSTDAVKKRKIGYNDYIASSSGIYIVYSEYFLCQGIFSNNFLLFTSSCSADRYVVSCGLDVDINFGGDGEGV